MRSRMRVSRLRVRLEVEENRDIFDYSGKKLFSMKGAINPSFYNLETLIWTPFRYSVKLMSPVLVPISSLLNYSFCKKISGLY